MPLIAITAWRVKLCTIYVERNFYKIKVKDISIIVPTSSIEIYLFFETGEMVRRAGIHLKVISSRCTPGRDLNSVEYQAQKWLPFFVPHVGRDHFQFTDHNKGFVRKNIHSALHSPFESD